MHNTKNTSVQKPLSRTCNHASSAFFLVGTKKGFLRLEAFLERNILSHNVSYATVYTQKILYISIFIKIPTREQALFSPCISKVQ
jgi:hypothetical protein